MSSAVNPNDDNHTKRCGRCKGEKSLDQFSRDASRRDGFKACCKACAAERKALYLAGEGPGRWLCGACGSPKACTPCRRAKDVVQSAARRGLEADFEAIKRLNVPAYCPVLGIPIGLGLGRDHLPSVDRHDNAQGYIEGNIWVVSYRANRLKSDATASELEKVLRYIRDPSKFIFSDV